MSFAPQTVLLKQQRNHVLNLAFQESFPALKARTFIPVNRSIPQSAETVSARIWDSYGEARVLNPNADDFPSVIIDQREAFAPIKSLGRFFEYSILDLRGSEMASTRLDVRLATATRQIIESKIDKLAVNGDERSFMRATYDAKRNAHLALINRLQQKVIEGKVGIRQDLGTIGSVVEKDIVQSINAGIAAQLKPATIKRNNSSKALIDIGRLKGSITHEVRGAS